MLLVNGSTHDSTDIYSWSLGGLLAAVFVSLVLLYRSKPAMGMHLYAWAGMIAVSAMTYGYAIAGGDPTSSLLILFIPIGLVCVSLALGWKVGRYYSITAGILLALLGGIYGGFSEIIIAVAFSIIAAILARTVGMLAFEAQTLKESNQRLEDNVAQLKQNYNTVSETVQAVINGERAATARATKATQRSD